MCLDEFLAQRGCAGSPVQESPQGSVGERDRDGEVLGALQRLAGTVTRRSRNGDRSLPDEMDEEVQEVAALAQQATPAYGWVVEPVVSRELAGVDSDDRVRRTLRAGEMGSEGFRERREAAIESDQQGRCIGRRELPGIGGALRLFEYVVYVL